MTSNKPLWIIEGEKNRAKLKYDIIDKKKSTLNVRKYTDINKKNDLSLHLIDLWVVLRKIFRNIFLFTIIIFVLPGFKDGNFMLKPFTPLVLQLFNSIIAFIMGSIAKVEGVEIFIGSPLTPISMYINLGIFLGVVASLPLTIKEIMNFIGPGLNEKELDVIKDIGRKGLVLFLTGAFISYSFILPNTLRILVKSGSIIGQASLLQMYSLGSISSLMTWGTLGGGLLYTSPLILVALVNLDVLNAQQITNHRKEIIMGVFLIAALITPDPTIISMVILSLPMIVIIELAIVWSYKIELNAYLRGDRSIW